MAVSIQTLREQRAAIGAKLKNLVDSDHNPLWNDSLQAEYDAAVKQVADIDAQIERIEAYNTLMADLQVNNTIVEAVGKKAGSEAAKIYDTLLRHGPMALTQDQLGTLRNAMSTTSGSEGGYTVPEELARSVIEALKSFGGMREVATVISTASGAAMSFPTTDGTSEEGEIVAENAAAGDADIAFGTRSINTFKFSSKIVTVPIELLQDSAVDLDALINRRCISRIGRITNKKFTLGTGNGEPNGIVPNAAVGVTGASTKTVSGDELIDLEHSVDPAYRHNGRWMFADSTLRELKKLKDDQGRPLWLPGFAVKEPDTILSYGYVINQDMPAMAAGATSILFGDFSTYLIRDALAMQMHRFTDSAFARKGQVGFLMFSRSGGNLLDVGGSIKAFKNAASAPSVEQETREPEEAIA
ncbi:phage major capsid protein [Jeongeupia naejangsanensis]|uniref:Phage major capsid protein n=1 Tax=Jeongeupia naejangsanensis TaxID=613195 RepID=A0ABS2BG28_9NEIS|nr:phage major capsid protein [Jeongeupia naejangsanensis]MBM3114556.1 phage major capsid protein [Jeongeupia naejangsanensis]